MAMRPTWQGHLRLSLVTCPVALFKAVEPTTGVSFNLINHKTHSRVKQVLKDATTGESVDRRDLVKGYAIAKDEYVLIEPDEIDALKVESTKDHGAGSYALLIEQKGAGQSLIQDLQRQSIRPIGINPEGDKVMRMVAQTAPIESGAVLRPRQAPWLDEFRREVLAFPRGKHDDQIDRFRRRCSAHSRLHHQLLSGVFTGRGDRGGRGPPQPTIALVSAICRGDA